MSQAPETSSLARMFGAKNDENTQSDEDGPSSDDVKKAKSDAFDVFWDAMHSKDKEGARKAWHAMHGEDEEEDDEGDADEDGGMAAMMGKPKQ